MAEYNPISICLNTITFKITIIPSTITIRFPGLYVDLYDLIIYDNISVPPVEAFAFKIIAVPIPTSIPP